MLVKMFLFEWRYFTRQPSFYICLLIFFLLTFLATSLNQIGMTGGGYIFKNGSYSVAFLMAFLSIFSMFLVVNFVADTAMRDHSSRMSEILYCKPIQPYSYQLGRFLGSFVTVIVVFSAVPMGALIGSFMPWVDPARFGSLNINYYLTSFFYLSVPTLFVFSCLFYALAIRFKSMMAVYLSVIAVIVCYEVSGSFFLLPSNRSYGALLDPFALTTFTEITRYWTVSQRNDELLTLSGLLLKNRLVWVSFGLLVMFIFGGFSRSLRLQKKLTHQKKISPESIKRQVKGQPNKDILTSYQSGKSSSWSQFFTRTKFEIRQVVFNPSFYILGGFTFILLLGVISESHGLFGTGNWPVTYSMVEFIRNTVGLLVLVVITYYSAEVVWRERSVGIEGIVESTPTLNWILWLSKLASIWTVIVLLLVFSVFITINFQLGAGYSKLDLSQYFISLLYFNALPWMMMSVLAFLFQVVSPNKYIGMLLFVLMILSEFVMEPLGFGHYMFRYSQSPELTYSDLDGYGHSLLRHSWYMLYWGALAFVLSIISYGLWQRGSQQGVLFRVKQLGYQIGYKGKWGLIVSGVVFVTSGAVIFYNTRIVNNYFTNQEYNQIHANYEKHYAEYAGMPVPTITKLNAAVDMFPAMRKVEINADMVLVNSSDQVIERFLISVPGYNPVLATAPGYSEINFSVDIEGGWLSPVGGELNTHWFEFDQAMQPGEQRSGNYKVLFQQQGFTDKANTLLMLGNGSFIQNAEAFPRFGYLPSEELINPVDRLKRGLPPPKRMHLLEEEDYYKQSMLGTVMGLNSGYLEFETTVSTAIDQIAIAPGYLQREWEANGRRYFHYKMDAPIENYFAYLSGKYEVLRSHHNGVDLGIYYHADHSMNVELMLGALKDSIDYFSKSFGPYQHHQMRIVEFAGPSNFAQDFPNTIAYSEQSGFIHDLRDSNEIDQVYYMTAHEVAHQWWGGQVDAANVQGGTMLVETLAQYSALMLFKKKYGVYKLSELLRYELDSYLRGRSREAIEELPLVRVENQPYIHYNKGSLAMMALVGRLGEERVNRSLKRFLTEYKFSQTGYPTTTDLMEFIKEETNVEEQVFINALFEQINLYDLKLIEVGVLPVEENRFEVTLMIEAHRFEADGHGIETEALLSESIDIGLYTSAEVLGDEQLVYLEKRMLVSGKNMIKVIVNQRPRVAIIDPFVNFIDRDSSDNTIEF